MLGTLQTARVTAVFKLHLGIHLNKEDVHLYRIFGERMEMPDQGKLVGIMAGEALQAEFLSLLARLTYQ